MHCTDSLTTFACSAKVQLQKRLIDNHLRCSAANVSKKRKLWYYQHLRILGLIDSSLLFHIISIRWKTLKIPWPSYTTRYHSTPPHLSPRCFCLIFLTSPSLDPRLCWNPVRTFKRFSNAVARRWSFSKAYILPEPDGLSRRGSGINVRLRHPRWWANGCHIWSWFEDCLSNFQVISKATLITGQFVHARNKSSPKNVHPKSVFKLGATVNRSLSDPSRKMPKVKNL